MSLFLTVRFSFRALVRCRFFLVLVLGAMILAVLRVCLWTWLLISAGRCLVRLVFICDRMALLRIARCGRLMRRMRRMVLYRRLVRLLRTRRVSLLSLSPNLRCTLISPVRSSTRMASWLRALRLRSLLTIWYVVCRIASTRLACLRRLFLRLFILARPFTDLVAGV